MCPSGLGVKDGCVLTGCACAWLGFSAVFSSGDMEGRAYRNEMTVQ